VAAIPSAGETRYRERCLAKPGVSFRGDERLLDVGCGNGGVARLLRRRVAEVVAVDVEASPHWAGEPGLTFEVADAEQLPFDDASFDVVHSKDSLHHMDDPAAALAEYRRVLRPGGTLLVVEGNRFNPVFYVHMTRLLGHEHFARRHFQALVRAQFPDARFGAFEAHYVPWGERLVPLQHAVEETLERIPGASGLLSYNYAVARA
jgi:ubiquinone/menaquinone biosynthesis C-methylase UbiE